MRDLEKFAQTLRAYQLVQTGSLPAQSVRTSQRPSVPVRVKRFALKKDNLLFGIAEDGKPLLLSLNDPQPGAILISADAGSGKTAFLLKLLEAAMHLKTPREVKFAVVTCHPEDFSSLAPSGHLLGVWSASDDSAGEMLFQLACRIEAGGSQQPIVLMVDGLDAIQSLPPAGQENLPYILANGPGQRVWPLVTANADEIVHCPDLLGYFRTRIYGRISHGRTIRQVTTVPGAPLQSLRAGLQFCLRENSTWLKFNLPSLTD